MEALDAEGVMSAVELLTEIGEDNYPDFTGKKVVVIGGGNVAMTVHAQAFAQVPKASPSHIVAALKI